MELTDIVNQRRSYRAFCIRKKKFNLSRSRKTEIPSVFTNFDYRETKLFLVLVL